MKRPTQSDVARLAGVSRATVSYIVNGLTESGKLSISEETRQRVYEAIDELGYEPNAVARSLGTGLSHTIGLLIPDMHNPHFWDIAQGVQEIVYEREYTLLLNSTDLDPDREQFSLKMLSQQRVDGLILITTFFDQTSEQVKRLIARKSPLVLADSTVRDVDVVMTSFYEGALKLMQYLLDLGHRRIALIYGVATQGAGRNRLDAYRESLKKADLPVQKDYIANCAPDLAGGYNAMQRLLDLPERPTAVVVINDLLAIGAMRALSERGLRVPDDISIAGFDDIPIASYLAPALTTVSIQSKEVGRIAANLIFSRLKNPKLAPQRVRIKNELLIRESTGRAPDL